jgi:hypothetical protein
MAIKLGTMVTDSLTGFTGIALCRTDYQYGCIRVRVQPRVVDGKLPDDENVDERQLLENDPTNDPESSELLGTVQTDSVTGITGTVVCYTTYLHAGPRVVLQPKGMTKEGRPLEGVVIDVSQLASQQVRKKAKAKDKDGGPGEIAKPQGISRRA